MLKVYQHEGGGLTHIVGLPPAPRWPASCVPQVNPSYTKGRSRSPPPLHIPKKTVNFARTNIDDMNYIQTEIDGVWVIEPKVFSDARGYFMEAFKEEEFQREIGPVHFVQDNESKSTFGVLRGLHYQRGAMSQAKLVRVLQGRVLDVAVDLRRQSPTFGGHVSVELSADNKRQLFIPRGFAHGFLVLSDEAVFTYKVDNVYAPQAEASIRFDDPDLGIDWPVAPEQMLLSDKDLRGTSFKNAEYFD